MNTTGNTNSQQNSIYLPALTGFITLLIGIGIGRFGYPPLIPALVAEKWFSVSQADYLGAANLTGYIIGSAFAAWLNRYLPSIYLIRLSLITVAITFACCAFPLSYPIYFSLRILAGLAGGILMVITAPTIFKYLPVSKKGLLSGIIFSGVGIGIALGGTLIPYLTHIGLKETWLTFSGISFLLMFIFWKGWPKGSNDLHPIETTTDLLTKTPIWNRTIILLVVSYSCNAVGFVPHTVFWVDFISRGLHMGLEKGTQFWVLLGLSAAIGPVIAGFLADRVGFARSIRISLFIKGIGVIMPIISTAQWSLAISSVFVGSFALGISSLAAGRVTELVAPHRQKKVWGLMTIAFSITHALTAYLLSFLFSLTGSYDLLFEIGAITLIIGSILDYLASES